MSHMDIKVFRGVVTALLLVLFCSLLIWAWSRKRAPAFDEAARLPLEDSEESR